MISDAAESAIVRANDALESGEWDTARTAFQEALAAKAVPEAYEGLSWAAWWLDDGSMTIRSREAAYRLYREAGDDVGAARMAMWLAMDHGDFSRGRATARGWWERARRLLEGRPAAPEHGWMPILECWVPIQSAEDPRLLKRCASQAISLSKDCGDDDVAIVGRAIEGLALVSESQVEEGMRRLDEAAAAVLGGELRQGISKLAILCFLVDACERVRDSRRAAEWCERMREIADHVRLGGAQGICRAHLGALQTSRGAWSEAEATLADARSFFEKSRPAWEPEAAVRLGELRRRQGRLEDAAELFRRVEWHPLAVLGLAHLAADAGRPADAEDLTGRYLRQVPEDNRLVRAAGLELRVRVSTERENDARAREALAEVEAIADAVGSVPLRGAAHLARATVAGASGELEHARACFEDALACFEEAGQPYEAGLARIGLARALVPLGRLERAREEAETARDKLKAIGAARASEEADAVAEDIDPRRSGDAGAEPRGELSRRQIEILRLVAAGETNKSIAAGLGLSEKTVDRHVSNIFNKLGVSSRAAATAHAYRKKLI